MNILMDTLAKLGFDWKLALVNLVNVTIIFLLLKKFLFAKVFAFIEERKKMIQTGVEHAIQAKTDLEMAEKKVTDILKHAKEEASEIIGKAHDEAKNQAEQIKAKSLQEIEQLIVEAKKKIKAEKDEMMQEAKQEVAEIVILAVEKVLKEKLTAEKDKTFIQNILKTL